MYALRIVFLFDTYHQTRADYRNGQLQNETTSMKSKQYGSKLYQLSILMR